MDGDDAVEFFKDFGEKFCVDFAELPYFDGVSTSCRKGGWPFGAMIAIPASTNVAKSRT
jgi:hypothetical protein